MKRIAPYYMWYPQPGHLQIRVKPRYWFALLVGLLVIPQTILFFWSFDAYCSFIAFFLMPFGETQARAMARDAHTLFPLFLLLVGLVVVAAQQLYKRVGLIEVTSEGVRFVRNPHFIPRGEIFVRRTDIAELTDEIFYVRFEAAGTMLILHRPRGVHYELIKIWGRDREKTNDYQILAREIRNVLGAVGT